MRQTLLFVLTLAVAALSVLAFRALAVTIYTVDGEQLRPVFEQGDRVMVNRWSYGLRMGGDGLFSYGRIGRKPVQRGDIVAFEATLGTTDGVLLCRCKGVPGDTVAGRVVPGRITCADDDYYWMETLDRSEKTAEGTAWGLVREDQIIGRAFLIVYNHDDRRPFWTGYRRERTALSLP